MGRLYAKSTFVGYTRGLRYDSSLYTMTNKLMTHHYLEIRTKNLLFSRSRVSLSSKTQLTILANGNYMTNHL